MTVRIQRSQWILPATLAVLGVMSFAVSGCGGQEPAGGPEITINAPPPAPPGDPAIGMAPVPNAPAESGTQPEGEPKPAEGSADKLGKVPIVIETTAGTIEAELDGEKAPITVKNFVSYIKKKHYDGTIFHRVIPGFMIQGGGMTADGNEKDTDPPIKNEASNGLLNKRGTLSMARTSDPDSATSQFFLSVNDNEGLDPTPDSAGYAVFGKVTKGMDVADKIVAGETTFQDTGEKSKPVKPVMIKSIRVKEGTAK